MTHFKAIFISFFVILVLVIAELILQFGINVKYSFPVPFSFRGEHLYNPYSNIDTTLWKISNFHAHTHKFTGTSYGTKRNSRYLDSLYTCLGYNIISISDYQKINPFESRHIGYIPVYEHGYQYFKNHHLVINAKKVNWTDYFFRQTLDNKQYVINRLKNDTSVSVAIAHPVLRKAYSNNDFKYLSNYDFLEIINNMYLFTSIYDTILSNGHPVFLIADDDAHDLKNFSDYGSGFNMINTVLTRDSILLALKRGRSLGVRLNLNNLKNDEARKAAIQTLPVLSSFSVENDTICLTMNKVVKSIRFIGQMGVERKRVNDSLKGSYFFTKNDTYIRTEIECIDGTLMLLNPVFRYSEVLRNNPSPPVDFRKTILYRIIFFLLFFAGFATLYYRKHVQK